MAEVPAAQATQNVNTGPRAVRLQQPVLQGLHRVAGVWVYASRGTDYWGPPIRLGAPPEFTLIELTRAV